MKSETFKGIGVGIIALGVLIIIAVIITGLTCFSSDFDDLRAPFIVLGVGQGAVLGALGAILMCIADKKTSAPDKTDNSENPKR